MNQLSVHLLPTLTSPDELAGGSVVVIDVLRATTTIVTALAAGARAVLPCQEIDEARRVAAALPPGTALLGGERKGVRIEGFDLGNSPAEYTTERVRGKTIIFTTTNGTRALEPCGRAGRVLFGAFVNLSAVCDSLRGDKTPVHLLCAGREGRVTPEDALMAGAVVCRFTDDRDANLELNHAAELAASAWRDLVESRCARPLAESLRRSAAGRNLIVTGQERDIDDAARIDVYGMVPVLDPQRGEIRLR